MTVPPYQPPPQAGSAGAPAGQLTCPKCRGAMRTYERNGIHLEQCDSCRGIFLDFGELEALTQLEARFVQQPTAVQPAPAPAPYNQQYGYGPGWGSHGSHKYRKGGFGRLFFSS
ncbi:zf-TFIIB domain-containing protein [Spongisporangium articulatum]|uniref:Zf-TFIIB domain-containing protein n=1 Tax=Spongisporangium articulatum TaxID=3362603 RepID=A0ABW8AME7_9ACTN